VNMSFGAGTATMFRLLSLLTPRCTVKRSNDHGQAIKYSLNIKIQQRNRKNKCSQSIWLS